jgi:hypothetical protein
MSKRSGRDKAAEVSGKAVAAVVGAAVGGPLGAVAAVALEPLLEHFIAETWREIGVLRQQSVGVMVQDAADRLEISPDDLVTRALQDGDRTQLLADAMFQSAQTFNLQKIKALARAVANGLRDDEARPDEEMLIVDALANVEAAHIKVLLTLPGRRSRPHMSSTGVRQRSVSSRGASLRDLAEAAGMSRESAEHVLAELVRTGMAQIDDDAAANRQDKLIIELQEEVNKLQKLIQHPEKRSSSSTRPREVKKPGRVPDPGYVISGFGRSCVNYLQDVEPEPEDEYLRSQNEDEEL